MSCPRCVDSVGIRILGLRSSLGHSRQANDAVASERGNFSENHDYKSFFRVAVNTYIPIFRDLYTRGGRKLRTDTHTHTRDNYSNPRCKESAQRVNYFFSCLCNLLQPHPYVL